MFDTAEAKGIIAGSFIVFILSLIDKEYQNKGSIINLRQCILNQTRKEQNHDIVMLSNKAWKTVLDKFVGDNIAFSVVTTVETIAFNFEKELKKVFGNNIIDLCSRFGAKFGDDNIEKEIAKNSYMIGDELKKSTDKIIFDHSKEIKTQAVV